MPETPEALKLKIANLEGKIQMLEGSNTKLSQENAALNNKIGTLDNQLNYYKGFALALELQLSGRGSIDNREEEVIPLWLRNSEFSRSQQWHITLHFKLTHEAQLLSQRLQRLKIEPAIFASKLERLYHRWGKEHHARRLEPPTDEPGWNELFKVLTITDRLEKKAVRALLENDIEPVKERTLRSSKDEPPSDVEAQGLLVLKNFSYRAKITEFKRYLQSQNVQVNEIVLLMEPAQEHVAMRSAGVVVVHVENTENVNFVKSIPDKYCAPGKKIEVTEKISLNEN